MSKSDSTRGRPSRPAAGPARLQKILSAAGVASRRLSEELIVQGRVTVNGVTAKELGTKADPSRDDIRVDGRRIHVDQRRRYILLNKPRGYVTTRHDPQGRPTVLDLVRGVHGTCTRRASRLRFGRIAAPHERRRPGRAIDAPALRGRPGVRGARARRAGCSHAPTARSRRRGRGTQDGAGPPHAQTERVGISRSGRFANDGRDRAARGPTAASATHVRCRWTSRDSFAANPHRPDRGPGAEARLLA